MKVGWPPYLPLPGPPPVVLGASPGSGDGGDDGGGGSGGQSVDTSARRHRRMSAPSTGIRLMPAFNDAAGDDDGGSWGLSSSSSGGLDLGPDASQPRYNRHRLYPEFSQMSNMGRLLFHGSALGSRTTDDDVLVMDGVLVANSSSSGPRRSSSFSDLGFVHAGYPGCSGRYASNRQCSYGKEESCAVPPMNRRHSEVELQNARPVQGAGVNMQAGRRTYHPLHPQSLSAAGLPTPAAIRPPAALYFTPPRATTTTTTRARTPAGSSWPPKRPEFKAPAFRGATFTWPPTEEEDAFISQYLYGLHRAPLRRLPVFASICPV